MESEYILKIGSKGEIFPPKEVRKELGLTKGQAIRMRVFPNKIIIQKAESLEEILNEPSKVKVSYHVLKSMGSEFD
jgi:bifunctional DNA-binding transcriptional regulator/antitoxin component of YhaV-PrlF toxin-antitoxin module